MDVSDFDRVARAYRGLEYLAFGRALERAREAHLPALVRCRRILVVGDGDGRALARIAAIAPDARIHCVDTSALMLQQASRRLPAAVRSRVTFTRADVRTFDIDGRTWDAIVTFFVLDCLTDADVRIVVDRLASALAPSGVWLYADFAIPSCGWRRLRARVWVGLLYAFFRWRTGLSVSSLPCVEPILAEAGFVSMAVETRQAGLIRSVLYSLRGHRRPVDPREPSDPTFDRSSVPPVHSLD